MRISKWHFVVGFVGRFAVVAFVAALSVVAGCASVVLAEIVEYEESATECKPTLPLRLKAGPWMGPRDIRTYR